VTQRDPAQLSALERIDLALASRMVRDTADDEPLAAAQRVLDGVRRPTPSDATFLAALLRLRGFELLDDDVENVLAGRTSRLSPITPDGAFLVDMFRRMTRELPRFRNNDLRRGPPWDAVLHVSYPAPEQLRALIDTFDERRCYRDVPAAFQALHPVRQGFRLMWRFARIAPFPDFNALIAWLGMNAWLQAKGFPLLAPADGDQHLLGRLLAGPPPLKMGPLEARLLAAFEDAA
jgi:hypothetical protein